MGTWEVLRSVTKGIGGLSQIIAKVALIFFLPFFFWRGGGLVVRLKVVAADSFYEVGGVMEAFY